MTYWQGVLSRLSVPGLALLALGAALVVLAPKLVGWFGKRGGGRAVMPVKVAGLILAVLGALILLDVFPNL
jgi:hypothetical protein